VTSSNSQTKEMIAKQIMTTTHWRRDLGSRGSKKAPARDRNAETKTFIDAVTADTTIDEITRKELISGANAALNTFSESDQSQVKTLNNQLSALVFQTRRMMGTADPRFKQMDELRKQIAQIQGAGSTFDSGAANLRKELDLAKEGQAPKYRYRAFLQKKKELMADRPGSQQLILSGRG
jgi:hypothetical protein